MLHDGALERREALRRRAVEDDADHDQRAAIDLVRCNHLPDLREEALTEEPLRSPMAGRRTGTHALGLQFGARLWRRQVMDRAEMRRSSGNVLVGMDKPRFVSVVTAINVLVASGFAIAGLVRPDLVVPPGSTVTQAATIFAMYAAARTIPLALVTFWAIVTRAHAALLVLGSLAGVVQLLDALVGLYQNDVGKTVGPLVLAILQFYAMFLLRKRMSTGL